MAEIDEITVAEGKYTLIMDPSGLRALRYGEPWRDLVGDGFVMALGHEIQDLREKATKIIGDLLAHAVYDEARNDACIEAVERAKEWLGR